MAPVFRENEFPDMNLQCDSCGWSGKGSDSDVIDFYGVSTMQQVVCPKCKNYIGDLKTERDPRSGPGEQSRFSIG